MTAPETSVLLALAERCERATGPDRELDGAIKLAVASQMFAAGASKDDAITALGGDLYADPCPYTASIDAAMTLVPERWWWAVWVGELNDAAACVDRRSPRETINVESVSTPALALCAASLRARSPLTVQGE